MLFFDDRSMAFLLYIRGSGFAVVLTMVIMAMTAMIIGVASRAVLGSTEQHICRVTMGISINGMLYPGMVMDGVGLAINGWLYHGYIPRWLIYGQYNRPQPSLATT